MTPPPPDAASAGEVERQFASWLKTVYRPDDGLFSTEGLHSAFVAGSHAARSPLLARLARAESALRGVEDRVAMECADLCRARADAYAKERETLTGLDKVLVLAREAAALSCENTILTRFVPAHDALLAGEGEGA